VLLAVGLGLVAGPTGARAAETAPPLVTTVQTVLDGASDVVNTITSSLFENPRADITEASVEYAPGWIRMKVRVKTPTDPLKDDAWSDRSDAEWALDTNNDGKEDYSVEFATDNGQLYGAVFDVNKPDDKSLCDADSASYSPQDGYTLVIDPACIGKPATLGYAVAIFFDTNPKDDKAPMATDRVPDQGFTAVAAPVQPGEPTPAPTAGTPTAPAAAPAPGAPSAAGGKTGAAPAPPGRTAAGSTTPSAPGSAPAPAPAAGGAATPGAPTDPTNLARTGSASEQRALLGLGVMLLGAGLLVMTRPSRRSRLFA
jgi:hypothetical protein